MKRISNRLFKQLQPVVTVLAGILAAAGQTHAQQAPPHVHLIDDLGGDLGFGENTLPLDRTDTVSQVPMEAFNTVFPDGINFYGVEYNTAYVTENGSLSFEPGIRIDDNTTVEQYESAPFPRARDQQDVNINPMIAIWYADLGGEFRVYPLTEILPNAQVAWQAIPTAAEVPGKLIATWHEMPTTMVQNTNIFQMILHSHGDQNFDVELRYLQCGDSRGRQQEVNGPDARIGFDAANGAESDEIALSNTEEVRQACNESNVGLRGYWYFLFRDGDPIDCGSENLEQNNAEAFADCQAYINALDPDDDGLPTGPDNCPDVQNSSNFTQESDNLDIDNDSLGNVCDEDDDNDGVLDADDNCSIVRNFDQLNGDGDGDGDCIDVDDDNDGILDADDNCPYVYNEDQDASVCEDDQDGDGVLDGDDNCPTIRNSDACDSPDDFNGAICRTAPTNADANYVPQADTDGDGKGDLCDGDIDNDGIHNYYDNCVFVANAPEEAGAGGAGGMGEVAAQLAEQLDTDGDGVGDACDSCPEIPNADQADIDEDNIGDACDDEVVEPEPEPEPMGGNEGQGGDDEPVDPPVAGDEGQGGDDAPIDLPLAGGAGSDVVDPPAGGEEDPGPGDNGQGGSITAKKKSSGCSVTTSSENATSLAWLSLALGAVVIHRRKLVIHRSKAKQT